MKILVFSDSHGELRHMEQAIMDMKPNHILHLGDGSRDVRKLRENFPDIPLTAVAGNCDLGSTEPKVAIREFEGVRLLMTHGHEYGVKTSLMRLQYAAMEAEAQAALFGHTHNAVCREYMDICFLNPGSAGGLCPSCGVVEIQNGVLNCHIVRL